METLKKEAEARMHKLVDSLKHELSKVRTGRANTSFLDHVMVDYYGTLTPLNQVASITVQDARNLVVTPWEKSLVQAIEKAILTADLGLNPASSGLTIRVPMPMLNEDRRKELIRVVKGEAEQGRVSIRNIRRDSNQHLKDLVKHKTITEDDERRATDWIQKITDQHISQIDAILSDKEKDLMEI